MKILRISLVVAIVQIFLITNIHANQLANSGFEDNPPTTGFGNHVNHPILPWVILNNGSRPNVIKADGKSTHPGFGADQGPWSDATNSPVGTVRHYLDIANGRNNFYQTFKARCSGKATFGGFFSTRANRQGQATVILRKDSGTSGQIIGQTNPVTLPGGQSSTDPWTKVEYTASVVANTVYTLEIAMGNNMNFDEGFVDIPGCPGPDDPVYSFDPCCPPIHKERIAGMFVKESSSTPGKYKLRFDSSLDPTFEEDMQAYINLHAGKNGNGADHFVFQIKFYTDSGFSSGSQVLPEGPYYCWKKPGGTACGDINRSIPNEFLQGQEYWIAINIFLEGPGTGWVTDYIPQQCTRNQVLKFKAAKDANDATINIMDSSGKVLKQIR